MTRIAGQIWSKKSFVTLNQNIVWKAFLPHMHMISGPQLILRFNADCCDVTLSADPTRVLEQIQVSYLIFE